MKNPRITKKEMNLIKGSLRRVFSRSELRRKVLNTADIEHYDPARPRVKKWSRCPVCLSITPKYQMVVDHQDPVIGITEAFEDLSVDTVIDRLWCIENNLLPMCKTPCHDKKTKAENKLRREYRRGRKSK